MGEPSHKKVPADWLEKRRELQEGPGVLAHCGGPREWNLPLCAVHSPLKSPQYWSKLCFRVPLRLQEDNLVWGQGMASSLDSAWMGLSLGEILVAGGNFQLVG